MKCCRAFAKRFSLSFETGALENIYLVRNFFCHPTSQTFQTLQNLQTCQILQTCQTLQTCQAC